MHSSLDHDDATYRPLSPRIPPRCHPNRILPKLSFPRSPSRQCPPPASTAPCRQLRLVRNVLRLARRSLPLLSIPICLRPRSAQQRCLLSQKCRLYWYHLARLRPSDHINRHSHHHPCPEPRLCRSECLFPVHLSPHNVCQCRRLQFLVFGLPVAIHSVYKLPWRARGQWDHRRSGRRRDGGPASRERLSATDLSEFEPAGLLWATTGQLWNSPCYSDGGNCAGNVRSGQWSKEGESISPVVWIWIYCGRHRAVELKGQALVPGMNACLPLLPIQRHGVEERRVRPFKFFTTDEYWGKMRTKTVLIEIYICKFYARYVPST